MYDEHEAVFRWSVRSRLYNTGLETLSAIDHRMGASGLSGNAMTMFNCISVLLWMNRLLGTMGERAVVSWLPLAPGMPSRWTAQVRDIRGLRLLIDQSCHTVVHMRFI